MSAVLLTGAAALALAYWAVCATPGHGWTRSAVKTGSTALLALAGLVAGAPGWITAGLALGALGDFALSRPGERAFLAGMVAFALGNLAYVAHLVPLAQHLPLIPALAMLALALSTERWLSPHTGALRWPVRGYLVIITAMMLAALALPAQARLLQAGAALFVASDLLLAIHTFRQPAPALARALWPAYWGGQALILMGARALA